MSETESLMLRILERIQSDVTDVKAELRELRTDMRAGFCELFEKYEVSGPVDWSMRNGSRTRRRQPPKH